MKNKFIKPVYVKCYFLSYFVHVNIHVDNWRFVIQNLLLVLSAESTLTMVVFIQKDKTERLKSLA